jgi:streptogramin lyase
VRIGAVGLAALGLGLTLNGGNAVAAVGDITEYSVPNTLGRPISIVSGPDGNLWFTDGLNHQVGKVTTSGAATLYPAPSSSPIASSNPIGIAAGPDGNLWFTENAANKVDKVTTAGVFTEYIVPTTNSYPEGITAGPDGNLWFTETSANAVGKVTTSGVFTGYAVPTASSGAMEITAGPDGNLWFTENNANQVAKLTTSGVFTEYAVPTASSSPEGITAGPDGNLWFTESGANKVAKVTTSGVFTEYTVPTASSSPFGITAGPDGNLWFIETSANKVAQVTTSGVFTEYSVPTANSFASGFGPFPQDITAGPDGNLWFTENNVSKVAKVSVSGVFTEYPTPGYSAPMGITAGPDGNIWFTEYNANAVAKVTPSGAFTAYTIPYCCFTTGPSAIAVGPDGDIWFNEISAGRLAKVTTSGVFTQYSIPAFYSITAGPDGDIWLAGGNTVAKVTTSGSGLTQYTGPTANSGNADITLGPDGNLWITEQSANLVAKVTTSGVFTEYTVPTANGSPFGITAGPDGNLWFTEAANKVARVTTSGVFTEYTVPTANSSPAKITAGADGNLWFTEYNANKVARVTTSGVFTEYAVPTPNSGPAGITAGPDGNVWFTEANANNLAKTVTGVPPSCPAAGATPATEMVSSTNQYTLTNSDGTNWREIDAANLRIACTPSASRAVLLTANADLWTANAGYNQDIGIFVSDNGGADTLVAWKESGGFAGTFSPNAAYAQALFGMTIGHSYTFKLKWKTNKDAAGTTIYAGAGPIFGNFSPTSLLAESFSSSVTPNIAVSTLQYTNTTLDGTTWTDIDATNLKTTLTPSADSKAVLGANADLWTANAGVNQDIGIFVSDNGGADTLVAWKESGGFAGTFSPKPAFVKATYPMTGGHTYLFKLKWKSNVSALGKTIYAGAGPISGLFSPTSLIAQTIAAGANPFAAVSTQQYTLSNSDGVNWQAVDPALNVSVTPGADTNSILGANADLWTANPGVNQDIGIFVSDNGGLDQLLAWKESGGFAGTYSPNAAFAQYTYSMVSGHTYVFKLKWKTNISAIGKTIYAGAGSGPNGYFSPTRLTVELTN